MTTYTLCIDCLMLQFHSGDGPNNGDTIALVPPGPECDQKCESDDECPALR